MREIDHETLEDLAEGIRFIFRFTFEVFAACAAIYMIFVLIWWIANLILG